MSGEAEELARLLAARGSGPAERAGAAALLAAVAGGPLGAEMRVQGDVALSGRRARILRACGEPVHEQRGRLVDASGGTAAGVTSWVVTRRVPEEARAALGISPSGVRWPEGTGPPLGEALAGLGAVREQGPVAITIAPCGGPAVISAALPYMVGRADLVSSYQR